MEGERGRREPQGWFYIHVHTTPAQFSQKTRRNISNRIKALWSGGKSEGFKKWGIARLRVGPQEILFLRRPHRLSDLAWA